MGDSLSSRSEVETAGDDGETEPTTPPTTLVATPPTTSASTTPPTTEAPPETTTAPTTSAAPVGETLEGDFPDAEFAEGPAPADPGVVCAGTRLGLSCLEDGEWVSYSNDDSPISGWVTTMDTCDNGNLVTTNTRGLSLLNDGEWAETETDFATGSAKDVECAGEEVWAVWFGTIGHFADDVWESWEAEDVFAGIDFADSLEQVVIGPDGSAWVLSARAIGQYANGNWTIWSEGNGYDDFFAPEAIAVDVYPDGSYDVIVSLGSSGLVKIENNQWVTLTPESLIGGDAMAVKNQDIFVSRFEAGVFRLNGGQASELSMDNGMSTNDIRDIAIDLEGNLWLATSYGVSVLSATDARTYRVDNSGLIDNDVYSLAVFAGGSILPAGDPKPRSGLAGVALDETGTALAGITVEACVENLRDEFDGPSPCAEDPYMATAVTDAEGRFEIPNLRPGRYVISMMPSWGWTYFTDGLVAARYDARPGEVTELGAFTLRENSEE